MSENLTEVKDIIFQIKTSECTITLNSIDAYLIGGHLLTYYVDVNSKSDIEIVGYIRNYIDAPNIESLERINSSKYILKLWKTR